MTNDQKRILKGWGFITLGVLVISFAAASQWGKNAGFAMLGSWSIIFGMVIFNSES